MTEEEFIELKNNKSENEFLQKLLKELDGDCRSQINLMLGKSYKDNTSSDYDVPREFDFYDRERRFLFFKKDLQEKLKDLLRAEINAEIKQLEKEITKHIK